MGSIMVTAKQARTGLGLFVLFIATALVWVQSSSAFSDTDNISTKVPESAQASAPVSVTAYMMLGILGVWASPALESNGEAE